MSLTRKHRARPVDPETPDEWQAAVDTAEFLLLLDSARQYGLVQGGPVLNPERCCEILLRGKHLGYNPAPHKALVERFIGKG